VNESASGVKSSQRLAKEVYKKAKEMAIAFKQALMAFKGI
jgi:hypothetical protein